MTAHDELQIAELIRSLPPPPEAWVTAAKQIPRTRRELQRLLPMIERDSELRESMTKDLEGALEQVGVAPEPALVAALRRRLETQGDGD